MAANQPAAAGTSFRATGPVYIATIAIGHGLKHWYIAAFSVFLPLIEEAEKAAVFAMKGYRAVRTELERVASWCKDNEDSIRSKADAAWEAVVEFDRKHEVVATSVAVCRLAVKEATPVVKRSLERLKRGGKDSRG